MIFNYEVITTDGERKTGTIDAVTKDVAISSLQRRGFVIASIESGEEESLFEKEFTFFQGIKNKEVVILSRQIATLFEADVSALRVFTLLATETQNKLLSKILTQVADDIRGGVTISKALAKHPDAFSDFYVNMVRSGEEAGRLSETFVYLADYLDRSYELMSRTRNALIYPAFVVVTFIVVMILMLTMVIPRLSAILVETGQEIPLYTKVVLGMSNFLLDYGIFFGILLILGGFFLYRYSQSPKGRLTFSQMKLDLPYIGDLYRKLYLSRIAGSMNTMLTSGISMVRAIEITSSVIDNAIFEKLLKETADSVRAGNSFSESLGAYPEIPSILVQMVKIGEETGELGNILQTLGDFYKREVENAVDTLVGLIEPVLIVLLGVGVGFLLTSVLLPIYNITAGI